MKAGSQVRRVYRTAKHRDILIWRFNTFVSCTIGWILKTPFYMLKSTIGILIVKCWPSYHLHLQNSCYLTFLYKIYILYILMGACGLASQCWVQTDGSGFEPRYGQSVVSLSKALYHYSSRPRCIDGDQQCWEGNWLVVKKV